MLNLKGCDFVIYADNAATTKLDIEAFEEMKSFILEDYANPSQPYSFSRKAKLAIRKARSIIAHCINADPEEIYFTSGGTESNNWAIKCFGVKSSIKRIITSPIEHHSILNACKNKNVYVEYVGVDDKGVVDELSLVNLLNSKTVNCVSSALKETLVSIMLANNEIGTVQDIKKLAEIAHSYGAMFHTDAVQAVGHIKIDVKELGIDTLSASAHKFNGPKGIGFLYIKKGTNIIPLNSGGSQEKGLRAGTENVASIVGMAKALENNCQQLKKNIIHINKCVKTFLDYLNLNNVDYIINGSNNKIPGNISISFKDKNGESLMHLLDLKGIYVSTGSACDSENDQLSHVIKAINCANEYAYGTIRISIGKYNSIEDMKLLASKLIEVLSISK